MIAPVMKLASSEQRNLTIPFSSEMSPKRPMGVWAMTFLLRSVYDPSGLMSMARFWSPMKNPGAMALTRILSPNLRAISMAIHCVKMLIALLAIE